MCSQKTWSDQAHVMVGKCAQPEKKINRARTRNPTQLDSHQLAVQCSEEAGYPVPVPVRPIWAPRAEPRLEGVELRLRCGIAPLEHF